jgi:hypothetical protein
MHMGDVMTAPMKISLGLALSLCLVLLESPEAARGRAADKRGRAFDPGQPARFTGSYLGQAPPGKIPRVFAPGFVSTGSAKESGGCFSPDGKEFYFSRSATIMVSRLGSTGWTNPEPASFSAGFDAFQPHVTLDNKRIYWGWRRPGPPGPPYGIWAADRTPQGWSAPHYVGLGMNVSSSRNGDVFVTDISTSDTGDYIAKAHLVDGRFAGFDRLRGGMDALRPALTIDTAHPAIAPDGRYIVFDVKGGSYLYVCFRQNDGTWGEAIDLTRHGLNPKAGQATISPDGKYLFFHLEQDIYWVSTALVEELRPGVGR